MAEERSELQDLLIRIDERVKSIQKDISEINRARKCSLHSEKIKNLERTIWGTAAVVAGIVSRVIYEVFK